MPEDAADRDRLVAEGWTLGLTFDGFMYAEPPEKLAQSMGHQAYVESIRAAALAGSLDAAWADAEAAKPEGWYGPLVVPQYDDNSEWMALVASGMQGDGSPAYPQSSASGSSPTLALRTLTERLRSERQT
jgi:hypothetical protein